METQIAKISLNCCFYFNKSDTKVCEDINRGKMNKEEQPRLREKDIMTLNLESEEGIKLVKQYQDITKRSAIWEGRKTKDFIKWLKGEEVESIDALLEQDRFKDWQNFIIQLFKENLKRFFRSALDLGLESLATVRLWYSKEYFKDIEDFFEDLKKTRDFNENKYPYSEMFKIFYGNNEYRENYLRKIRKERNKVLTDQKLTDLVYCIKCRIPLTPKAMDTLIMKGRVYCTYCGILNRRKYSFEAQSAYLEAKRKNKPLDVGIGPFMFKINDVGIRCPKCSALGSGKIGDKPVCKKCGYEW